MRLPRFERTLRMAARTPSARVASIRGARLGIVVALGTLLASCTSASTTSATVQTSGGRHAWTIPDTLRIGTGFVPRTLNPLLATENIECSIDRLFSDSLITLDARGAFVPDLATAVPSQANGGISADGLTIRYKLRPNVTWQDGKPFSSADIKFTFDAIMNPSTGVATRHGYDVIERVETHGPFTVVFRLKHRFAPFLSTVFGDDNSCGVLPAHLLAKYKSLDDVPYNSLPIGTGPFRVVRWLRGNQIELVRNDAYFLGKPKLKSIVIKLIPSENTEITQLQTHEIDWFFEASVNAYKTLRAMSPADTRIVLTPINGFQSLLFNNATGPTKDIRIRRAVAYALDKTALVHDLTFGAATVATQDLPTFSWAYDRALRPTPYDLNEATRLLAQAGYGPEHRLSLELYYDESSVLNKTLSVQIQSMLAPLGIDVNPHAQLSSTFTAATARTGRSRAAFTRWRSSLILGSRPRRLRRIHVRESPTQRQQRLVLLQRHDGCSAEGRVANVRSAQPQSCVRPRAKGARSERPYRFLMVA